MTYVKSPWLDGALSAVLRLRRVGDDVLSDADEQALREVFGKCGDPAAARIAGEAIARIATKTAEHAVERFSDFQMATGPNDARRAKVVQAFIVGFRGFVRLPIVPFSEKRKGL